MVWIGSKKYSGEMLCPDRNLSWGSSPFRLLGINFDVDLNKILDLNYKERHIHLKNLAIIWSKRNLIVIGKISVVKTLMLPVLNYLFLTLPNPTSEIVGKINEIFYNFIWNSPVHRIKKEVLYMDYMYGGLKMIDISNFIIALKCTWMKKVFNSECKWLNILHSMLDKERLYNLGSNYTTKLLPCKTNNFWYDVFSAWQLFLEREGIKDWNYLLSTSMDE